MPIKQLQDGIVKKFHLLITFDVEYIGDQFNEATSRMSKAV
jgi:hypothetical protein